MRNSMFIESLNHEYIVGANISNARGCITSRLNIVLLLRGIHYFWNGPDSLLGLMSELCIRLITLNQYYCAQRLSEYK